MRGLLFDKPGESLRLVDNLSKPRPGPTQILVKSVAAAINPLDHMMLQMGILVVDWPCVIGCDAGGVVEEVGTSVQGFQVGDKVCGVTRIGLKGYATFQEHFLMDERLALKVPQAISIEEATTIGGGAYTAAIGFIKGLKLELPADKAAMRDEWIVILGGTSSVGQFAIQLARICGYKVLASCSPQTKKVPLDAGADDTFSYRDDEATQLDQIKKITGGNFSKVFDAAAQGHDFAFKFIDQLSATSGEKYFTTTNSWSEIEVPAGLNVDRIELGGIGREETEEARKLNDDVAAFIPKLHDYLKSGAMKPLRYEQVGPIGFEGVLNAMEKQKAGQAGGVKIIARIAADA